VLASRGSRFGAALLNGIVASVPIVVGFMADPASFHAAARGSVGEYTGATTSASFGGVTLLGWSVVLVVNGILLARRSQSIGKVAVGIEIVRTDGSHAGFWRLAGLRWGLGFVIYTFLRVYWLIDVLFIVRKDRRCLHDLIAGTVVVERNPGREHDVEPLPTPPLVELVRPVRRCPACAHDMPGDSVYCSNCGGRLDAVPVRTGADAPPAAPPEQETFQW
jgi:uncharacterized RDD family membrane protein YckC